MRKEMRLEAMTSLTSFLQNFPRTLPGPAQEPAIQTAASSSHFSSNPHPHLTPPPSAVVPHHPLAAAQHVGSVAHADDVHSTTTSISSCSVCGTARFRSAAKFCDECGNGFAPEVERHSRSRSPLRDVVIEGWRMGSGEVLRCSEDDWDGLRASIITAMEREQREQNVKEELDVSDTDTDVNEPGSPPVLTRAHPCSPVLSPAHPCSPVLTRAHPCSPQPTRAHPCSPVLSPAHPCSPVLTRAHPCSPQPTRAHPCSPVLTPAHPNARET